MKLILDTSAYIDLALGRPEVVNLLATRSNEFFFLPRPGRTFLLFYVRGPLKLQRGKLRDFIATLGVSIIDITEEIARKYAVIFLSLTTKGARIPINDVWIAACCMGVGGTLVTRDRHFDRVEQIDKIILSEVA